MAEFPKIQPDFEIKVKSIEQTLVPLVRQVSKNIYVLLYFLRKLLS